MCLAFHLAEPGRSTSRYANDSRFRAQGSRPDMSSSLWERRRHEEPEVTLRDPKEPLENTNRTPKQRPACNLKDKP